MADMKVTYLVQGFKFDTLPYLLEPVFIVFESPSFPASLYQISYSVAQSLLSQLKSADPDETSALNPVGCSGV